MLSDPAAPAVVARTKARRVEVTGDDRARYLEDVTTQRLQDAEVGEVRSALHLDRHGAPLAVFDAAVLADRLTLLAPDDEVAAAVVELLGTRTFLLDARFEPTGDEVVVLRGDAAHEVAGSADLDVPAGRCRTDGDLLLVGREAGVDLVGAEEAVVEALGRLITAGAVRGGDDDLEAWRVTAGEPVWGREIAAPHLPEEMGLLPTHVHLDKGCYPGQEAVARMWMLGRPRRRLATVALEAGEVAPGSRLGDGGRVAAITSVSPRGDRALAYVPADVTPGETIGDGATRIEVVAVVGADLTPPGHDPGVTLGRDRRAGATA